MQPLNRTVQRRVWARVYSGRQPALTHKQQQMLRQCLERSKENLSFYESMQSHRLYAEAFARLHTETAEHIKMLKQMLR